MNNTENNTNLLQALSSYASAGWAPFHMPGHKRNPALDAAAGGVALPYALDITEIDGFDNLQNPQGILLDLSRRAAAHWECDAAWVGVNGGTGAVLAGIRAMTSQGDTVLVARNSHMSVFHAIELCGLRPVFLEPAWLPDWGIYGALSRQTLEAALRAHPEAALCIVTSPTYEGILSPVDCPIPLFVDAAHGAAVLADRGARLPLPRADLAAVSLHKTLPALTQTALLLAQGPRADKYRDRISRAMNTFQTSSPSYVLLASVARCLDLLQAHQSEWFAAWDRRLDAFYAHARRWRNLRLFSAPGHDRGKLLLRCHAEHAAAFLRARKIEPEYARKNLLLLLTSCCDTEESMARLTAALDELDRDCPPAPAPVPRPAPIPPETRLLIPDLCESVPAGQAPGRVCAEYIVEYPPGVPLCVPGQRITEIDSIRGHDFVRVAKE